ncbi:Dabb family protein [Erysipelatoclostridium sp. AM42-17]|uniref:Dabb family protein n=2 Tax=Coprobacillaceae TaxID=2810280 RepID=UPI000E4C22FA|nr:Dabb family protein [Erysipelatoclostridium sp. AM42-17]RHS94566.1 Dabb family protein [Erysipelatoclostridium sp. AM42-17]
MIKHMVMWNLQEGKTVEDAKMVKSKLEGLKNEIDFLKEIHVYLNYLTSSDRQIVLECLFETEDDLKAYQVHPKHVAVSNFVKSVTNDRVCIDYQM